MISNLSKIQNLTPLIKNSLKLSSSNVILYLLPFVVTPVLSRIYSPSYFGEWAIFSSTFTIISVAMFGSYDNAIVQSHEDEVSGLAVLSGILGFITICLTIVAFSIGGSLGIEFFIGFPYKSLLYVFLLLYTFSNIASNILNREGQYGQMAISNLINGSCQAFFRIIWGYFVKVWNGLIIGTIIASFVNCIYLFTLLFYKCELKLSAANLRIIAKRYYKFPLYDCPALLLQFASINLPVIILSFYFSKSDLGCYSLIVQLLVLPIAFIGSAIGKVYYQEISGNKHELNVSIKTNTLSVLRLLSYLCILPSLFIVLGGDSLIVWFLGDKWHLAGKIALCMTVWSIPTILIEPLKSIFRVLNRQHTLLAIEVFYFIISITSLILGCICHWSLTLILLTYSLVCATIKVALFNKILLYSGVRVNMLPKSAIVLLIAAMCILIVRYAVLFIQ